MFGIIIKTFSVLYLWSSTASALPAAVPQSTSQPPVPESLAALGPLPGLRAVVDKSVEQLKNTTAQRHPGFRRQLLRNSPLGSNDGVEDDNATLPSTGYQWSQSFVQVVYPSSYHFPGRYIIRLADPLESDEIEMIENIFAISNITVIYRFDVSSKALVVQTLDRRPITDEVLEKLKLYIDRIDGDHQVVLRDFNNNFTVQQDVTKAENNSLDMWGLDRLSDDDGTVLDGYFRSNLTGHGVNIYLVDSGVDIAHPDFEGRAEIVYPEGVSGLVDCEGHGTHVSALIAGKTYGVAKNASIKMAQVFKCGELAAISDSVNAIEWIVKNHQKPAILNLSFGTFIEDGPSDAYDKAIRAAMDAGIIVVGAAGNDYGKDACKISPGSVKEAIIVGGTFYRTAVDDENVIVAYEDTFADFTNIGECVSIYAPGQSIPSAQANGTWSKRSGTSQSTPFVSGVAALYLQADPEANTEKVKRVLLDAAHRDILQGGEDIPNNYLLNAKLNVTVIPRKIIVPLANVTVNYVPASTPVITSTPSSIQL